MCGSGGMAFHRTTHRGTRRTFLRRMFTSTYSPRIIIRFNHQKRQRSKPLILFLVGLIIGLLVGTNLQICEFKSIIRRAKWNFTESSKDESNSRTQSDLMFVGVLTAKDYKSTRAVAINETWASTIPGKVIFFSGENSNYNSTSADDSFVALPGVQDTYPPQKKAFLMLKYMHDFYLDQFEWFVRADDDVYIKGDKLAKFLASVNSSELHYIGQSGEGREDERGKLGLSDSKTYCMGGPGVIMSRATLAKVAPNISYCLKNLYTSHEDTELGRCINQFVNVSCTRSSEVSDVLTF